MALDKPLPAPPTLADLIDAGPVSLFIDFDGTLVDIAERPDAIFVPETLGARLEELSKRLDGRLALVSGRALGDVERHLGACAICRAGSHGISRLAPDGTRLGVEPNGLPDEVFETLTALCVAEGLELEIKAHGGAIHYRSRPEKGGLALVRAHEIAQQYGLSVKTGKSVVELVEPSADKGEAVRGFMLETPFAGSVPLFIGDDLTDEDGFAAANSMGGFGIAVGDRPSAQACFHLDSVTGVHQWLDL